MVKLYNIISSFQPVWSGELRHPIFGQRIFSLGPFSKIMSCQCVEHNNMSFDKANQILILFICPQTVCQTFLVNSENCMKVSPTAFPFSNKNKLTTSDRLHVFIHFYPLLSMFLFHSTFICGVSQTSIYNESDRIAES